MASKQHRLHLVRNQLQLREKKAWEECSWQTDKAWLETRFLPGGRRILSPRDFFHRYDLMAARPGKGILVLIQVSTEGEKQHESKPMGFEMWYPDMGDKFVTVEDLRAGNEDLFSPGVYEVYTFYRKLKTARGAWVPDRRWWELPESSEITGKKALSTS